MTYHTSLKLRYGIAITYMIYFVLLVAIGLLIGVFYGKLSSRDIPFLVTFAAWVTDYMSFKLHGKTIMPGFLQEKVEK